MKEVKEILIKIEWKKNRMFGHDPHAIAEVSYKDRTFEKSEVFKHSGCSYSKLRLVVSDIFNKYLSYKRRRKRKETPHGIFFVDDKIHYLGGIRVSYYEISKYIGGTLEYIVNGDTFDVYKYTDKF